jgi:hypothetical protein
LRRAVFERFCDAARSSGVRRGRRAVSVSVSVSVTDGEPSRQPPPPQAADVEGGYKAASKVTDWVAKPLRS